MDQYRYYLLMKYPEFYFLDDEEIAEGWHYCPEWDFLLVGPGAPEYEFCICENKVQGVEPDDAANRSQDN